MTATIEELDISQLFDHSIECEIEGCAEDAMWILKRCCCKRPTICCDGHKVKFIDFIASLPPFMTLICPYCNVPTRAVDAYYDVEPL